MADKVTIDIRPVSPNQEILAADYNRLVDAIRKIVNAMGVATRRGTGEYKQKVDSKQNVFDLSVSEDEEGASIVSVFVPESVPPFIRTSFNSDSAPTVNEFFADGSYERTGDWVSLGELSGDIVAWLDPESDSIKFTDDYSDVSDGAVSLKIGEVDEEGVATNSFTGIFSFAFAPDGVFSLSDARDLKSIGFRSDGVIQLQGFDGKSSEQMFVFNSTPGGLTDASGTAIEDGKMDKFDLLVRTESDDGAKTTLKYMSKDVLAQMLGAHEIEVKDSEDKPRTIYVFHKKLTPEEEESGENGSGEDEECGEPFPGSDGSGSGSDFEWPDDGSGDFPGKANPCW